MIKITFKHPMLTFDGLYGHIFIHKDYLRDLRNVMHQEEENIDTVEKYIPTKDIWLDREFILNKLKSIEHVNPTYL